MKPQRRITIEAVLLIALFALIALGSFAAPMDREVLLSGKLLTPDRSTRDMVLSVEVEGACLYAKISDNGHFSIVVPPGSKATLSFIKPGHLTKEVFIDTESAFAGTRSSKYERKLEFDVVMVRESNHPSQSFIGPVGSIGFVQGSGSLRVRHQAKLTAIAHR